MSQDNFNVRHRTKNPDQKIKSVSDFMGYVFNLPEAKHIRCFRGQSNSTWKLNPSVLRSLKPEAEQNVINELMAEAPDEFVKDRSMFERLVRAQHYGLPTRLLDVTLNPLTSLFFACSDDPQSSYDGKVFVLDFDGNDVRFPDSDTVSLICNLARLTDEEREALRIGAMNETLSQEEFCELPAALRLINFVQTEKPHFENRIQPSDFRKLFFLHTSKSNKRIAAQSGAFIAVGSLSPKVSENFRHFTKRQVTIPAIAKEQVLRELNTLNINFKALFPEMEYAAQHIKRRWEKSRSSDIADLFSDIFG